VIVHTTGRTQQRALRPSEAQEVVKSATVSRSGSAVGVMSAGILSLTEEGGSSSSKMSRSDWTYEESK